MTKFLILVLVWIPLALQSKPAPCHPERQSSAPYISGDSFRAIADHIFDETDRSLQPHEVKTSDVIFVKTDYLEQFFSTIHPHITCRYILITHNSDYGAPGAYARFLDDEKIIAWFGMNPTITGHLKFIAIPIGIANRYWQHGNVHTFSSVIAQTKNFQRPYLLGLNFYPGTNIAAREFVYQFFIRQSFCTNISSSDHATYLTNMAKTKFVLSPPGNGLDCHRTWEALLMGAIPILKTSLLDEMLLGMPVLIIDDWTKVTENLLRHSYPEIIRKKEAYGSQKIYFPYWENLIRSYKR